MLCLQHRELEILNGPGILEASGRLLQGLDVFE
jgi:hypothetical protein